jgi:hypothetical protein
VLTLGATIVTPFGAGAWSSALALAVDPQVRRLVAEWQPTSPLSVAGSVFFGSVVAAAVLVARRPRAIAWPWLLWLAGLVALGIVAERGIAWWAIGAPPIVSVALMAWLTAASRRRQSSSRHRPSATASRAWLKGAWSLDRERRPRPRAPGWDRRAPADVARR